MIADRQLPQSFGTELSTGTFPIDAGSGARWDPSMLFLSALVYSRLLGRSSGVHWA